MGWEERNGRRYFYRKVWSRSTCQSQYIGAGEFAEVIATLEELDRQRRAFERNVWRAEVEADQELDRQVSAALGMIRTLRNAVLLVSGYHTHKGQWRKRRNG